MKNPIAQVLWFPMNVPYNSEEQICLTKIMLGPRYWSLTFSKILYNKLQSNNE